MFRSRLLIDRRIFRTRRDNSPTESELKTPKEQNNKREWQVNDDKNNNLRTTISNNFDFIEPCDIDEANDSLESLKIKNWKYHLTNNKF